MFQNIASFDIETVPDTDLLRLTMDKPKASDDEIIVLAKKEQLAKTDGKNDFLPLVFHKVVVISLVFREGSDNLFITSRSLPEHNEAQAIEDFYSLIDRHSPQLVSWNGTNFDLPVLTLRAMHHGIVAEGFWSGPGDKWNQYSSRFHDAHLDLMDVLAHRGGAKSKLENVALACGLPGKMGFGGNQVLKMYQDEKYDEIRSYCKIDALNTYLLWVRFQLLSGKIAPDKYEEECALVKKQLAELDDEYLTSFLDLWNSAQIVGAQTSIAC